MLRSGKRIRRSFSQHPIVLSGEFRTKHDDDKPCVSTREKYKASNPTEAHAICTRVDANPSQPKRTQQSAKHKRGGGNYGSNSCSGLTGEIPGPLHRFLGLKGAHRRLTSLLPTIPLPLGVGFRLPTLAAPSGREAATRTRTRTGEVQQYAKQANSQLHP